MKTSNSLQRGLMSMRALMLVAASICVPCFAAAGEAASPAAYPASQASSSAQPSEANDGSDYIAAWSVMGEICEVKYPDMKPAIDEFWTKRWNKATRERVANMKRGADFKAKVEKHRKNLSARRDEILDQCGRLFTGGAH